ncbi:hypothetical protein [Stutzerimonas kunmingensis]|uniref:hypothetical protein n=1 Tax=Stutzerimonas kunmingensis TaxID=1211807 RepID=UPI00289D2ADE|nr:hypothetical protein [Stutzerimonas kunmingensis]
MGAASIFKAAMLAMAIAGASAEGTAALTLGIEAYKEVVNVSQSLYETRPAFRSPEEIEEDLAVRPAFLIAFVLGRDCLLNRPFRADPWAALKAKLAGAQWQRVSHCEMDDQVISIMISTPPAPWELLPLLSALREHSFIFAVDDGSGFFSPANTFSGANRGVKRAA